MPSSQYRNIKRPITISALAGFLSTIVLGETASYTDANTVITSSSPLYPNSSAMSHLTDGTYKAFVYTDATLGPYGDYSVYLKVDIGASKKVKTVFVVNIVDDFYD